MKNHGKAASSIHGLLESLDRRRLFSIAAGSAVLQVNGSTGNESLYAAWIGTASNYTLRVSDGTNVRDFAKGSFTFTRVVIYGGSGDDKLEAATNTVTGAGFNSFLPVSLEGGAGNDTLYGSDSADRFEGGSSDDVVYGYAGDDGLSGSDGSDALNGMDGNDFILGGLGNDAISGGSGADTINGEDGTDTVDGGSGADSLSGGLVADLIFAGRTDNALQTVPAVDGTADVLYGNALGAGDDGSIDFYGLNSAEGDTKQES